MLLDPALHRRERRRQSRRIGAAGQVGGKGGGKPDMAMAGGTDPSRLPAALASVQRWVEEHA